MIEKIPYDSKIYTGVTSVDCKAILLAIQQGESLLIDRAGHIYDSHKTVIANGKERVFNGEQRDLHGGR